jgi:hypothetical protein
MLRPDMITVDVAPIEITCTALLPLMNRLEAPGPVIVRFLLIDSVLARVMVEGAARLKLIVSPLEALAMAARREPDPLSAVLVTVKVAASADEVMKQQRTAIRIATGRFAMDPSLFTQPDAILKPPQYRLANLAGQQSPKADLVSITVVPGHVNEMLNGRHPRRGGVSFGSGYSR